MDDKLKKLTEALLLFGEEAEAAGCGKNVKEQLVKDLLNFLMYVAGSREKAERAARRFLENGIPADFVMPEESFGEKIPESLRVFVRADREADDGPTKREESAAAVLVEIFRILGETALEEEAAPDGENAGNPGRKRLEQCLRLYSQPLA